MLSRSRTMATRMIGGFDERDTCLETEAIRMRLCNARAMWAAAGTAGSYNGRGILRGSGGHTRNLLDSILHGSDGHVVADRA